MGHIPLKIIIWWSVGLVSRGEWDLSVPSMRRFREIVEEIPDSRNRVLVKTL